VEAVVAGVHAVVVVVEWEGREVALMVVAVVAAVVTWLPDLSLHVHQRYIEGQYSGLYSPVVYVSGV
jgi:hypothetical protein